jgi:hypothetical protein
MGQIDLTAIESTPALTDALFDTPLPFTFLHPNCPLQYYGLCCLHGLRSLILDEIFHHANSLCVVNELFCETAKELAITSLLVVLVNNMLISDATTRQTCGMRGVQ